MAKRVPPDREEYRPVNEQLVRAALHRNGTNDEDDGQPRAAIVEPQPVVTQQADETPRSAPPERVEEVTPNSTEATPSKGEPVRAKRRDLVCEKRMLLTKKEDGRFEELVSGISQELGTKVKASNVLRACLTLLVNVEGELRKQCRRVGKDGMAKRPRYDEPTEIVAFEDHLARIFDTAIRNAKSYD
ncbi:MAG: hypothetical protein ACXV3D_09825 [Halobacteriota archaeon]